MHGHEMQACEMHACEIYVYSHLFHMACMLEVCISRGLISQRHILQAYTPLHLDIIPTGMA